MAKIEIKIPDWLDKICTWPVLVYRKRKFGYTFRRIDLGEGEFTIVDPDVYYQIANFKWYLNGNGKNLYAYRNIKVSAGKTRMVAMHRQIMGFPKGLLVDHRNNHSLDNRIGNLRPATRSQNMFNRRKNSSNATSCFRGVHFSTQLHKWIAKICVNGKRIWLGVFDNEIDAARAYDRAALKYFGEFARLNFPREDYVNEIQSTNG